MINPEKLTNEITRHIRGAMAGSRKGKYGTEHIATALYEVERSAFYFDNKLYTNIYAPEIIIVVASTHKRALKKLCKRIRQLDQKIIEAERISGKA